MHYSCIAVQMQMVKSNDCVCNLLEVFPLKLNVPIKSFLLLSSSVSCLVPFLVVIVLSAPYACLCLDFRCQIC